MNSFRRAISSFIPAVVQLPVRSIRRRLTADAQGQGGSAYQRVYRFCRRDCFRSIQDQDRGVVVGRRTFGKGLVQRPLTFDDGSEIRLTIAHYYTPSGRCIQKPYKKGDRLDYAMDLDNRYKHGEFTNQDSIHLSDSLKYYTLRKHRVVYGGGGIMPDYFVPLDTTKYTKMHRQLAAKSIVINHSLKFIELTARS